MTRKVRILLVDDNSADRTMFRLMMFGVDKASDAQPWWKDVELVESAEPLDSYDSYNQYDGVVLDYHLPGHMTGFQIAQQLHIRFPFLPIMLMTGLDKSDIGHKEGLPPDAREWVDQITFKYGSDMASPLDDPYAVSRAFIRGVAGLRKALDGQLDDTGVPKH